LIDFLRADTVVRVPSGTEVKVLESGKAVTKVMVTGGFYAGRIGYVWSLAVFDAEAQRRAELARKAEEARKEAAKKVPYRFVRSKTEPTGQRNVMDLYAFAGDFYPDELRAFCRERLRNSTAPAFYYAVIFDDLANARFPSTPFTAEFGVEEDALRHIRAIYAYNRRNGFSEVRYHPKNLWEHAPTYEKIQP
jgi:hypothetical protein